MYNVPNRQSPSAKEKGTSKMQITCSVLHRKTSMRDLPLHSKRALNLLAYGNELEGDRSIERYIQEREAHHFSR